MLTDQVCNSDNPSTPLLVDSQLLGLWFSSGNSWSRVIQEDCLNTLIDPVHTPKKSQLPSNLTLVWGWLFLFITVAAMLDPLSNFAAQEPFSTPMKEAEQSAVKLLK